MSAKYSNKGMQLECTHSWKHQILHVDVRVSGWDLLLELRFVYPAFFSLISDIPIKFLHDFSGK